MQSEVNTVMAICTNLTGGSAAHAPNPITHRPHVAHESQKRSRMHNYFLHFAMSINVVALRTSLLYETSRH